MESFHFTENNTKITVFFTCTKHISSLQKYHVEVSSNLFYITEWIAHAHYFSVYLCTESCPTQNKFISLSCDQKRVTNVWTISKCLSKGHTCTICFQKPEQKPKHDKKEDFKVKLTTSAAYKIKPLFKIRQDSGFLSKMSTKANMANFKILQSLF